MDKKLILSICFLFIGILFLNGQQTSIQTNYHEFHSEIKTFNNMLYSYINSGNSKDFLSHFDMSPKNIKVFEDWFSKIQEIKKKATLKFIEITLPVLGIKDDSVYTTLGSFITHFAVKDSLFTENFELPELILKRNKGKFVFFKERLAALKNKDKIKVKKAFFTVEPNLKYGATITVTYEIVNAKKEDLKTIDLFLRHPIDLEYAKVKNTQIRAEAIFGTFDKLPINQYSLILDKPIKPNESIKIDLKYDLSYKIHKLGRKPVGFSEDRGFILPESSWYPQFRTEWCEEFSYDMKIILPKEYKASTYGKLINQSSTEDLEIFNYSEIKEKAPFFIWGKYQEIHQKFSGFNFLIWIPKESKISATPMTETLDKIISTYSKILPVPSFEYPHKIIAVTRFGGYGAIGNLLLQDPYFSEKLNTNMEYCALVAHEFAHSWINSISSPSGSLDQFISEGLAEYLSAKCIGAIYGIEKAKMLKNIQLKEYLNVSSRAIAPKELTTNDMLNDNRMYRGVIYSKGAFFFWELENILGEQELSIALSNTLIKHKGKEFSIDDFITEISKDSNIPPGFFTTYLESNNHPDIKIIPVDENNLFSEIKIINTKEKALSPIKIKGYDNNMNVIFEKSFDFSQQNEFTLNLSNYKNIQKIIVDPDRFVLQKEDKNDIYPDYYVPKKTQDEIVDIINKIIQSFNEDNKEAFSNYIASDPKNIKSEDRIFFISKFKPFSIEINRENIEVTKIDNTFIANFSASIKNPNNQILNTIAYIFFVKENESWKFINMRF